MDLSLWTNLNNKIIIENSNRLYYKQYLYKLSYKVYNVAILAIRDVINEEKLEFYLTIKYKRLGQLYQKNHIFETLNDFRLASEEIKSCGRRRIESSTICFFSNDIDLLYRLASQNLLEHKEKICSLTVANNEIEKKFIEDGYLIMRENLGFKYRVNIRSGFQKSAESLPNLGRYLEQIPGEVRITKKLLSGLKSGTKYFHGGYFYINDERIIDIIRLMDPTLIRSLQKIVVQ